MQNTESQQFELNTLSCLFLQPKEINKLQITVDDFISEKYKKIFLQLQVLVDEKFQGDDTIVWKKEACRRADVSANDLLDADEWGLEFNLSQLRLCKKQIELKNLSQEVDSLTHEEIDDVLTKILNFTPIVQDSGGDIGDFFKTKYREFISERKLKQNGLFTGFIKLDNYVGFERKQLILLGARPSVGKSAFAGNIAYSMAKYDFKVLYLSLEMSKEELTHRFCAHISKVPTTKFKYADVSENILQICEKELEGINRNLCISCIDKGCWYTIE